VSVRFNSIVLHVAWRVLCSANWLIEAQDSLQHRQSLAALSGPFSIVSAVVWPGGPSIGGGPPGWCSSSGSNSLKNLLERLQTNLHVLIGLRLASSFAFGVVRFEFGIVGVGTALRLALQRFVVLTYPTQPVTSASKTNRPPRDQPGPCGCAGTSASAAQRTGRRASTGRSSMKRRRSSGKFGGVLVSVLRERQLALSSTFQVARNSWIDLRVRSGLPAATLRQQRAGLSRRR